jgi:hypothetical protein
MIVLHALTSEMGVLRDVWNVVSQSHIWSVGVGEIVPGIVETWSHSMSVLSVVFYLAAVNRMRSGFGRVHWDKDWRVFMGYITKPYVQCVTFPPSQRSRIWSQHVTGSSCHGSLRTQPEGQVWNDCRYMTFLYVRAKLIEISVKGQFETGFPKLGVSIAYVKVVTIRTTCCNILNLCVQPTYCLCSLWYNKQRLFP